MVENSEKKHFVLVHGFCHGAWCWYKLVPMLELQGHKVTALDLGGCGVHPKQLHQISSISDYIQPLLDFLAALPDDDQTVILVGHSYGGIPISLAMENFPGKISVAVFVSAYMPNCSDPPATLIQEFLKRGSTNSLMDCEITFDETSHLPISAAFGPEYMAAKMYANCPSEDLELAKTLVRPSLIFLEEMSKTYLLSEERYGAVRRCYVICEEDEVMEEEFQRYIIEKSPPEDVVSVAGAGHMIMLAKPQELCSFLTELAENYNHCHQSTY